MNKRILRIEEAQGANSAISAKMFFTNNNPDGIVDATVFLDYYEPLTANGKKRYAYLWQLLKNGTGIINMLMERPDKDNKNYVWVEFELPRGKAQFKMMVLSKQMFDFIIKYQKAEVSVRFTLEELLTEAERIENGQSEGQ